MRNILILILIIISFDGFSQNKAFGYYKCLSFYSSSAIPVSEKGLLEMKVRKKYGVQDGKIKSLASIKKLGNILLKATKGVGNQLEYNEIRLYINISGTKYFVDKSKKNVIYKGIAYNINNEDFKEIIKLINCTCS
jgi:hypothetical protein